MKRFEVPMMYVQSFDMEDIIASSGCSVEAQNCDSCYSSAGECDDTYKAEECPGCYDDVSTI